MTKKYYTPDERLDNIKESEDSSFKKDTEKLVEVKKKDTAEDADNDFTVYDKPFDEQMHDSSENDHDEEAD